MVGKASRQAELRKSFCLNCKCEACLDNWPTYPLRGYTGILETEMIKINRGDTALAVTVETRLAKKMDTLETSRPSVEFVHILNAIKKCFHVLGNKRELFAPYDGISLQSFYLN